jgi:starch synthase (maltosyl-transferring)
MSFATAPRIYCINPALVAHQGWPALLDHCVALGFDHVLLANALNLGQSPGIDDRPALAELTAACSDRGLCLLLDIVLDRVSSEDPLIDACPGWFENKSSPESKSLADGPSERATASPICAWLIPPYGAAYMRSGASACETGSTSALPGLSAVRLLRCPSHCGGI